MQLTHAVAVVAAILLVAYFATKQSALPERAVAIGAAVAVLGALAYKNTTARGGSGRAGPSSGKTRTKENVQQEIDDLRKKYQELLGDIGDILKRIDGLKLELSKFEMADMEAELTLEATGVKIPENVDINMYNQAMDYIDKNDNITLDISAYGSLDDEGNTPKINMKIKLYKKDGNIHVSANLAENGDDYELIYEEDFVNGNQLYEFVNHHDIYYLEFTSPLNNELSIISNYDITPHGDVKVVFAQILSLKK